MFGKKKKAKEEELIEEMPVEIIDSSEDGVKELTELDGMLAEGQEEPEVKKKKKLPGWVIIPVILVMVIVAVAGSKLAAPKNTGAQFDVVEAKKESVKQVYITSGTVEGEKTKIFYSPVNAPITTCNVKAGQAVKAGDVLLAFDTTNLERDNQQSELNTLAAKYSNQDAVDQSNKASAEAAKASGKAAAERQSNIDSIQSQIQTKQNEINQLQQLQNQSAADNAAREKQIQQVQAKITKNQQEQTTAKSEKEKAELIVSGTDPTDTAKYEEAVKAAADATAKLSDLEFALKSLQDQLAGLQSGGGSGSSETLVAANSELESLKASLAQAQNTSVDTGSDNSIGGAQLNNMKVSENLAELAQLSTEELVEKGKEGIKAEFDGIVSDVKALESGEAAQGMELFTLVGTDDIAVKLEVPANDFENLVAGSKASVKIGQKTYEGTMTSVDKIALPNDKGNPVIGAKVHIDNPDDQICIGVTGKATMTVAEKKGVVCVPNEVLNTSSAGDFVYIIKNGTIKKQLVEVGIASSKKIEIVSGLKEGDEVISDTSGNIKEGMEATGKTSDGSKEKE